MSERECRLFSFGYRHEGRQWAVNLWCYDWFDAEARARLLNLTLEGCIAEIHDANTGEVTYLDETVDDEGPSFEDLKQGLGEIERASPPPGRAELW